jgi:hypothetical protein
MKRFVFAIFTLMTLCTGGRLFAQQVKTPIGDFTLNGILVTGALTTMTQQEGNPDDGKWSDLVARQPDWEENRFELGLSYEFMDYGAYVSLWTPGPGLTDYTFGTVDIGHAFVFANFLDNKIKVGVGKQYSQLFLWPGTEVWQTRLIGNNFFLADNKNISFRMEFKPINGLNIGWEYFLVKSNGDKKGIKETQSWKEFGIGGQYELPGKFAIQAGLRFDSDVDGVSWLESDTLQSYVDEYYGLTVPGIGILPTAALDTAPALLLIPGNNKFKHIDELYDFSNPSDPKTLSFDGGGYTYFGFQVNAIEDWSITGRGGFFNIGAFDKFGYAFMLELIQYDGIKNLPLIFTMTQSFHGKDVYKEGIVNSPLFTFEPEVWYNFPNTHLSAALAGTVGFCKDVLEYQFSIQPKLAYYFGIGTARVDLFYKFEHKDFVDAVAINDVSYHKIGLNVLWTF